MDKNTTCIMCLAVDEDKYYDFSDGNKITELDKIVCEVEEDLMFFKKNVFIYTENMNKFAIENKDNFKEICLKYLTVDEYNKFKRDLRGNFQYDFLTNLFIKFPFLNFSAYLKNEGVTYKSISQSIDEAFLNEKINEDMCEENEEFISKLIENLDDEEKLIKWIDSLEGIN